MKKFDRYLLTGLLAFGISALLGLNSILLALLLIIGIDALFEKNLEFVKRLFFSVLVFVCVGLSTSFIKIMMTLLM